VSSKPKPKHELTRDLYWQCNDLYSCGLSFQAIRRIVGFSGWAIRNWLLLTELPSRRFHAMGRFGDKTWYVDNPDPKWRGEFLSGEREYLQGFLDKWVDTENGPIMPGMTTRCHESFKPCWNAFGYTRISWRRDKKKMPYLSMHRLSYALNVGIIPPWHGVYHKCDNPLCCNPEHLFSGRLSANSTDRDAKGRGNLCAANRVA